MKRSLYIPRDIWEKLGELSGRLGLGSKSKVICYLATSYAHYTHTKNTGKTPGLDVGRGLNDGNVGGVAMEGYRRVGGVLRVSMAEVEMMSPEVAKKIRAMGPCTDESVVEFHLPAVDEAGEVDQDVFDALKGYKAPDGAKVVKTVPDVVDVVKADEDKAKEAAVANIKKDLDQIMNRGVRSYSKEQQLGKGRKK